MKAITILNKIKEEEVCSIARAELLTKALHREEKLNKEQAIRFMPLYGKFDIVNADLFSTGEFKPDLCNNEQMGIDELINLFK